MRCLELSFLTGYLKNHVKKHVKAWLDSNVIKLEFQIVITDKNLDFTYSEKCYEGSFFQQAKKLANTKQEQKKCSLNSIEKGYTSNQFHLHK